MKNYIIKTEGLTKTYKNQLAVDRVNLNLDQGAIYGLIGENGSGKSTLLKMIVGMVLPSQGSIELFGGNTSKDLNNSRRKIGSLIETPSFFPYMSARDNLTYYAMGDKISLNNIDKSLDLVGLTRAGNKKFKNFSLGMKQRLGIAFSIMAEPDILILDEPVNGLDPSGIIDLRRLILQLNKELGLTVLISSHILDELSQVATTYGFMKDGKLVKEVSSNKLREESRQVLKLKTPSLEKACIILEEKLNLLDYRVTNDGYIYLYKYVDKPEFIVKLLYENGQVVQHISEEGLNLEDYYMNLVGGNLDEKLS